MIEIRRAAARSYSQRPASLQFELLIFMTGGAFTDATRDFLDSVPNERIYKPFDVAAVRELVMRLASVIP